MGISRLLFPGRDDRVHGCYCNAGAVGHGSSRCVRRPAILLLALAITYAFPALAQTREWKIDPNHSTAQFTVRHMGVSNVTGTFNKVSGTAQMDEKDLTKSAIDAAIDVTSVDTRVEARDKDLRSDHFFDVAKYPTMEFKSKRVEKQGDDYKLIGDLTMHGVSREVALTMETPSAIVTDPYGNLRQGFSANTVINRKDWGMTYNNLLQSGEAVVGDKVKIQVDVELIRKKG
jgi:polyisoprenoid-binding protein YceI